MAQQREVAWRIFAVELNSSTLEDQGAGDKAPLYLITPLGAKVNRVLVAGVITDIENTGTDTEPLWRVRMADPTGIFYISAGQYQPEASQVLATIKPPEFAAVVGKVRTYKPETGVMYISIRPEVVKVIDSDARDAWVLDTCGLMETRLKAMREGMEMEPFSSDRLMSLGYHANLVEGVQMALEHYKGVDIERYTRMLTESVRYLLDETGDRLLEPKALAAKVKARSPEDGPPVPKGGQQQQAKIEEMDIADEGEEITPEEEATILEIVAELEEEGGGVALWQDIVDGAVAEGMERSRAEEALNQLQAKGEVSEPTIGKIKRVG